MFEVPLKGTTIPHRVQGHFGASRIMLIPAAPGTGVIAGSAPRAVLEMAGIKDVLTKAYGSTSPKNLVKATIHGLQSLRSRDLVEKLRGVKLDLPRGPEPNEATLEREAQASAARERGNEATRQPGNEPSTRAREVAPGREPSGTATAAPSGDATDKSEREAQASAAQELTP
jgi:hypothetical protein